jgi:hypothetical protein
VTALAVARLLVRFRWQSLWNGAWRVPRPRSMRLAWLLLLLVPAGYVALFGQAFAAIARTAPFSHQVAVLALVAGAIVLASATAKMASSETVVGGSGENEFLLARPVALPTLVMARSFAGAATDFFDALFLFPVLVSAVLVWGLGLPGVLVAAGISVIVQVGVSAAAQAGQILVVRLVPPPGRRLVWAGLALLAALTLALLWTLATWVLRRQEALVEAVGPWAPALWVSPGGLIVAPLAALARGSSVGALLSFAAPLELTVLALVLARLAVGWAGRAGWEQAGTPWAEAARGPEPGARMTPFTKDWYLILRDRSRLVTLVAVPVIFVGVQVFGSAGWSWTTESPRHAAVLAYSVAAYMAGFGPLFHMESERRAFWLLRVAPVPLGRLLAWKAAFWATVVGGMATVVACGLLLLGDAPVTAAALGLAGLAGLGAALVSTLAVAMASAVADFSDDTRRSLGLGTLYLFLFVSGLFNVALLEGGEVRLRALALYVAAVGLHWRSGVEGAAHVFDPGRHERRRVSAGDGASLAILLFLGTRAQAMGGLPADPLAWAVWPALLAAATGAYLVRRRGGEATRVMGWGPALGIALAIGVLGRAATETGALPLAPAVLTYLFACAAAEELIFRGVIQRALAPRGRAVACAVSVVVALAAGPRAFGLEAMALSVAPALAMAVTGRLAAAGLTRVILELFSR